MVGKENQKCAKCGITLKEAPSLTFHRFPQTSKHGSLKAKVWAKYCFPDSEWTEASLKILYSQHKMLCRNHFDVSSFTSNNCKRLHNFAIPTEAKSILYELRGDPLNVEASQVIRQQQSPDRQPLPGAGNSSKNARLPNPCPTQDSQEDDDVVLEDQTYGVTQSENDVTDQSESNLHVGYKCNVCDSDIKGFRYVCVQCVDWDMCSGCEAKAAHSHHYVLRVPGPRPLNEIQPVLERIRRELMELSVFIEDSIKEENDLGDQMDPLQEEVNSIGVVNTLPDIEDEQMNSTLIFDNIDHFSSDDEVTNDTKQITTKISSVLPNTSNITKSESSGSSAMNITKSEGSAFFFDKCDLSVRPTTCVENLQKSIFHTKKLSSKHFSSNLKVIGPKPFVRVERSDLKQKLSHIRSQSIKKK